MDINFECTMCGKCCHGLKLPLSVEEALLWLKRGGEVQFLCEAIPWPDEPSENNLLAQHKRRRSFPASSGSMPVRIVVVIAAAFEGACPNLQPDLRCGVYAERPTVCRIYPAEVNPFIDLNPSQKACPPEAWTLDKPPLMRAHRIVNSQTAGLIDAFRSADVADTRIKALACKYLTIDTAALANEGMAAYSPPREESIAALQSARMAHDGIDTVLDWHVVSNRQETVATLTSIGARSVLATAQQARSFQYLGFFHGSV